ncbi:hypothetical protein [Dendronalium sp. ChiSLP03b]|uniref:hypothetical protein n=1 Tax=Dendronalium sp. ChiSLP03b TaxID=3075381 RepID=UPI002AD3F5E5|nr:hypothetical protein [Dendronalium sp. ChiSLP03b]MDZ8203071.1 hypothetical protein [Dendronalium sp. ChiSLP03b]
MSSKSLKHLTLALVLPFVSLGILTACVQGKSETTTTLTQAQVETFIGPSERPNMILNVKREAGVCPQTVGIWTFLLPFEGGAEHTAVADIRNAMLLASGEKFLEYEAPLRQSYVSCVGSAKSERPRVYSFQFRNGKAYFRLDLNQATLNTTITYQGTGGFRPYVRWIAAE